MAKSKKKQVSKPKPKPKEDEQVMDGLNMPFEDVMKVLINPDQGNIPSKKQ